MTREMTVTIRQLMKENPMISVNEIAKRLRVSAEIIRYRIKVMKRMGEVKKWNRKKSR